MNLPAPVLSAILTIIGGAVILVLGEIFKRAVLDPVHELKKEIARVAYSLDFYANQMPRGPKNQEAREEFRKHACALREKIHLVLLYEVWIGILSLPSKKGVMIASRELIGYSNRDPNPDPRYDPDPVPQIRRLLGIAHADDFLSTDVAL